MTPQVANAPLSYGAFEMTVGTDFAVPDPERILEAIGAAGYAGTDLGPPGYYGEGDVLRERLEHERARGRRRLRPHAILRGRGLRGGRGGAAAHAGSVRRGRRDRRATRAVRRRRSRADRQPRPRRRGSGAAAGRRALAHAGRAIATAADIARERGYEPVFHHHTSTYVEGMPGDRALPRGHRRASCCSTPATCSSPAATRCRRSTTGATASAPSTSRTSGSTCSQQRQGRARRHADRLAPRAVLRARAGRRRPRRFCAALRARLRRLGRRRAGPRARRHHGLRGRRARAGRQPRVAAGARRMVSLDVLTMGRISVDVYPLQVGVSLREVDVVRQVPRRQPDQRRGRRRPLRPPQRR